MNAVDEYDFYTEPNPAALGTAIALRLAGLATRYPDAMLWGDTLTQQHAELICWGGAVGTVWAWRFAHADEYGTSAASEPGDEIVAGVAADPLTGDRRITAGPTFGSLGLAPVTSAACAGAPDLLVTVFDGEVPGLQLYRVAWQDMDSPEAAAAKEISDAALEVSAKRRRAARPRR